MKRYKNIREYRSVAALLTLAIIGLIGLIGWLTLNGNNQPPCSQTRTVSHGGPVCDYVSFIDNLRAKGALVEPVSEISDPVFDVKGQQIRVDSENVQVYEYNSSAAAKKDLGSVMGSVFWVSGTRLYQKENLIAVLNSGSSQKLVNLLTSILGKPAMPAG